jgi:two-component system NtrC family sensor kinase
MVSCSSRTGSRGLGPAVRFARAAVLSALVLLGHPGEPCAAAELALDEDRDVYPLRLPAEILEDPGRGLTFEDVHLGPEAARFRVLDRAGANLGYTDATVWLRFQLRNSRPAPGTWLLELNAVIEHAELHEVSPAGVIWKQETGAGTPFDHRIVRVPNIVFRLGLDGHQSSVYYLRVESRDTLAVKTALWSQGAFTEKTAAEYLRNGIYYGVLLSMILYNLFIYLFTKDRVYLWYVSFQVAMVLGQLAVDKLAFQYLWPELPRWAARSEQVFGCAAVAAGTMFARRFLEIGAVSARLDRVLSLLTWVVCALGIVAVFTEHARFKMLVGLAFVFCVLAIFYAAVAAFRAGRNNARFFLVAWSIILASVFIVVPTSFGLVPAIVSPDWILKIGSAAEAMLLSLALANRISIMRREREHAQLELLELRAAQAQELEHQIAERTRELSQALDSVHAAQERLIQQERLAALGRLVSGVAHEIGNPLNFTLGGASDLARRLEVLGAFVATATPASGAAGQAAENALVAARKASELIVAGNERIKRIINDLRSYVASGDVEPVATDLVAGIEATLEIARDELALRRIAVVKRLGPMPLLLCRPGQMNQVFLNLLLNSCKAMPGGGTITISAQARVADVEMVFSDTGPGIDPAHRHSIFEPFFTTQSPQEGTGLGLYICQEIVSRHGGSIRLADVAVGATFVITLPLGSEPSPATGPGADA